MKVQTLNEITAARDRYKAALERLEVLITLYRDQPVPEDGEQVLWVQRRHKRLLRDIRVALDMEGGE